MVIEHQKCSGYGARTRFLSQPCAGWHCPFFLDWPPCACWAPSEHSALVTLTPFWDAYFSFPGAHIIILFFRAQFKYQLIFDSVWGKAWVFPWPSCSFELWFYFSLLLNLQRNWSMFLFSLLPVFWSFPARFHSVLRCNCWLSFTHGCFGWARAGEGLGSAGTRTDLLSALTGLVFSGKAARMHRPLPVHVEARESLSR